jgi:hypothetical protein
MLFEPIAIILRPSFDPELDGCDYRRCFADQAAVNASVGEHARR